MHYSDLKKSLGSLLCTEKDITNRCIRKCDGGRGGNGDFWGIFGDGDFGIFLESPKIPKKTIFRNNFKTVVLIYF